MEEILSFVTAFSASVIDWIIPPSELERMEPEAFIARARRLEDNGSLPAFVHALFSYKDPLVRKAIWELKYRGNKKIAGLLGTLLYEEMLAEASELGFSGSDAKILLIPIPSSKARMKEKGFNQTHLLADCIARNDTGKIFSIEKTLLIKSTETKTQVSIKNRSERLKNLAGAFSIAPERKIISEEIIFLIDDVSTTGATFSEAKKVLLHAGAKRVLAFAVAH